MSVGFLKSSVERLGKETARGENFLLILVRYGWSLPHWSLPEFIAVTFQIARLALLKDFNFYFILFLWLLFGDQYILKERALECLLVIVVVTSSNSMYGSRNKWKACKQTNIIIIILATQSIKSWETATINITLWMETKSFTSLCI